MNSSHSRNTAVGTIHMRCFMLKKVTFLLTHLLVAVAASVLTLALFLPQQGPVPGNTKLQQLQALIEERFIWGSGQDQDGGRGGKCHDPVPGRPLELLYPGIGVCCPPGKQDQYLCNAYSKTISFPYKAGTVGREE